MSDLELSYVIPFKDWGLRRIGLAVESARASLGGIPGEVIVSDYGSEFEGEELDHFRSYLESRGAVYVRTETDGVWSRSRALNAGMAVARGRVLVAADADMVVPPDCLQRTAEIIGADPNLVIQYSCLDLPADWGDAAVADRGFDWEEMRRVATLRPRWGMGLTAVSRQIVERVRGWDERFVIYGGEDNDFAQRVRRAGARVCWPHDDAFHLFHMWHPLTSAAHALSADATRQIRRNKDIVRNDRTFVRNSMQWRHPLRGAAPLVSVVVSTFNRRRMLQDTINSVLIQTMQDFEIVVVDDGSTDDTADYVMSIDDPRVRYVRQDNAGIAAARNRGTDEARGQFIAVLDDDDLMLPWRLECQLAAVEDSLTAVFGSFVNFNDATGEMVLTSVKEMTVLTAALAGGAPGHSTWLIPREWMARVRYDENLTSGVDNDLALRLLRAGVRWASCGRAVVLRRMHEHQVTVSDNTNQLGSASAAYNRLTFTASLHQLDATREASAGEPRVKLLETGRVDELVAAYLPDHLVRRVRLRRMELNGIDAVPSITIERSDGVREGFVLDAPTWDQLVELGPEASSSYLFAAPVGTGRYSFDPQILHSLQDAEAERVLREAVGERPGDVAMAHRGDEGGYARITLDGHPTVIIESGTVADPARPPHWWGEWLARPGEAIVSNASTLPALRHAWYRAVAGEE